MILFPVCSSLASLIHHPHARAHAKILLGFQCQLHMSCCPCLRPTHCGSKKMFSNIFHLPLFISIPCQMSLTACKLIYNAVFSWVGWRMGEMQWRLGVWEWVQGLHMTWWQQWKPIFWRANLIGAIFIPGFLDFREERFGQLLASGSLWQPQSRVLGE